MDSQTIIDLGREAIWQSLILGGPVLVTALAVGLIIGLLQALTQIQEQTVAFVPKIVAMMIVLGLSLPWLFTQWMQYAASVIGGIPDRL